MFFYWLQLVSGARKLSVTRLIRTLTFELV